MKWAGRDRRPAGNEDGAALRHYLTAEDQNGSKIGRSMRFGSGESQDVCANVDLG
jgi:hypothetical protein